MSDISKIDVNGTEYNLKDSRIPALPSDSTKYLNGTGAWSALVDVIYPVGSIYMSTASANPGTFLGGTWTALPNRFLVGAGDTYASGATGGEAEHMLVENEIPTITEHMTLRNIYNGSGSSMVSPMAQTDTDGTVNPNYSLTFNAATVSGLQSSNTATQYTFSFGGGQAHNNLPPYLAVYMWERTA